MTHSLYYMPGSIRDILHQYGTWRIVLLTHLATPKHTSFPCRRHDSFSIWYALISTWRPSSIRDMTHLTAPKSTFSPYTKYDSFSIWHIYIYIYISTSCPYARHDSFRIWHAFINTGHPLSIRDILYQYVTSFSNTWHPLSIRDILYQYVTSFINTGHPLSIRDILYQYVTSFINTRHPLSIREIRYEYGTWPISPRQKARLLPAKDKTHSVYDMPCSIRDILHQYATSFINTGHDLLCHWLNQYDWLTVLLLLHKK